MLLPWMACMHLNNCSVNGGISNACEGVILQVVPT